MDKKEAAKYLLQLDEATQSFMGFVRLIYPQWEIQWFQKVLIDALDQLEKGTLTRRFILDNRLEGWRDLKDKPTEHLDETVRRLLINMPPRHANSSFASHLFPAYYMLRNARRQVMSAC